MKKKSTIIILQNAGYGKTVIFTPENLENMNRKPRYTIRNNKKCLLIILHEKKMYRLARGNIMAYIYIYKPIVFPVFAMGNTTHQPPIYLLNPTLFIFLYTDA